MRRGTHADGLFNALADFFPVPDLYREADTDWTVARQLLDCDDDTLTELVRRGLPAKGDGEQTWFDQRDIFNLALHSGSGTTPPECAFRYALRWMALPTVHLISGRAWTFTVDVRCSVPSDCDGDPGSAIAPPTPQVYGGGIRLLDGIGDVVDASGRLTAQGERLHFRADIQVAGEVTEIRSPQLREIYAEFLASSLRWIKLPAALQADVDTLLPRGVATCVTSSLYLETHCRSAGLVARTRRGWVLGMLDLVHAWVEVDDIDGSTKVIDPIFGLFAAMLRESNPVLRRFDTSVRTNRLLPTALSAAQPLATHHCRGSESEPQVAAVILPVSPNTGQVGH